ncbi:retrovirus-related pol polyprotein from transposon TNT 1-94 [Tanacetum coccineum]|uniref:Retrovirus-related pol polyprotein from transposon TNT 1-94 n=1 Tax=Tanacetum coccineum TaxID=301880 RepID=A0ABQ5BXW0_9ASTR
MYIDLLKRSENYKAQPYQYSSSSKQILKAKAKPFPPCTHCGFNDHRPDDYRNYPECEIYESYDYSNLRHNRIIQIRGGVLVESSQSNKYSIGVKYNTCGSTVHSTSDHNEFDHFKRGEKIQEPIWYLDSGCSRSMTGVKSYLYKYVEQPGPKVVFGDNSSCITERYGSTNCGVIVFTKVAFVNGLKYNLISISQLCDAKYIVQFDDKQGTIFNANIEIILIAPRRNDVYVLDMSSLTPNGACFSAKASESVNWLWHKRLSHLNFKNINKLAKQNKVLGLPSLVYSKDKPCTSCEKGKHHRASFKTKQNLFIRKCLHLLHMDLFGPVHFLRKKSQAPEVIMSFIRMVENQNDVNIKQIRTDNGTKFRNHELESFYDEKGISHNFSSPYTPEQNGVAERKNKTLIEATRTMLNGLTILMIAPNEPEIPHTEDTEGPLDLINTEGAHEQNIQNDQMITQPTNGPSGNNTKVLGSITESLVPDDIYEGMLIRIMAAKLTAASASECLFADFLSEIEPKKVSETLKHPGWIDAMQEELNQFYKNKVWTLVPLPYGKIAMGSKWVFKKKKDEHGTTTKNKVRLVVQGYSQEEGIDYNETFAPVARMEAVRIFLAFATYINFKVYQMDVKSAFLNALYGLKQVLKACSSVKTPMVPLKNLGPDLAGKPINETSYRGIGSLMYLTTTRPDIQFSTVLCFDIKGYSDSDYVGCNMDKKSTSAEAEYVVAAGCCASILWMKSQLNDYDIHYKMVPIFCDNISVISISNNPILHSRTKHIDIRYHFIRDHILKGDIELHFIPLSIN